MLAHCASSRLANKLSLFKLTHNGPQERIMDRWWDPAISHLILPTWKQYRVINLLLRIIWAISRIFFNGRNCIHDLLKPSYAPNIGSLHLWSADWLAAWTTCYYWWMRWPIALHRTFHNQWMCNFYISGQSSNAPPAPASAFQQPVCINRQGKCQGSSRILFS